MPQLPMFDGKLHTPVSFTAAYTSDPLNPDAPGRLLIGSRNSLEDLIDFGTCPVSPMVTHELVDSAMSEAWAAYLFGEVGDVRRAVGSCYSRWKTYLAMK